MNEAAARRWLGDQMPASVKTGGAMAPGPLTTILGAARDPALPVGDAAPAVAQPHGGIVVKVAQVALVLALAAYALSTVVRTWADLSAYDSLLEGWLYNGILVAATGACLARSALVRAERAAWVVLGAALALWTAGNIYYQVVVGMLDPVPFPTPADFLWLAFYPLAYVSVILLVRARVQRFHPSLWLDGAVGGLGVAVLGAAFVLPPIASSAEGTSTAVAVNLAFPLADGLLLSIIAGVFVFLGRRPGRSWLLLGAGLVTLGVADSWYLLRIAGDSYTEGTLLDALWPAAMVLIALAAWRPTGDRVLWLEGWIVLAIPTFFTLSALTVLVYGHFRRTSLLVVVLATATLLAAMVRTAITFREIQALSDTHRQARTDELTGLGNRRQFYEHLETALADRRPDGVIVLLLLDLDRFKEINDSLGHHVGDMLLRLIGPRLTSNLRASFQMARLGGDEFAILIPSAGHASLGIAIAQRTLAALEEPFVFGDVSLRISASVGIAMVPSHASDADTLLQRADVAMYQAKRARSGYKVYDASGDLNSRGRLQTIEELRTAITDEQLVLHYQPKLDLRIGEVTGVEALVRWNHPERGLLQPDSFIGLAEQTGVMRPLTLAVLDMALSQCRRWRDEGLELTVAVNLSVSSLLDSRLTDDVVTALGMWNLPASAVCLEITEHVLMADPVRARTVVDAIRARGIEVSVDDYGTGYSSLSYLHQLSVDELKVDKSFVLDMTRDATAAAIVRSTIDLARSLGLRVVAEGVDSQASLDALTALGCDVVQGFHMARPQPGDALAAWLRASQRASAH